MFKTLLITTLLYLNNTINNTKIKIEETLSAVKERVNISVDIDSLNKTPKKERLNN